MKSPQQIIREMYLELFERGFENTKFVFESSEKLILWIVGFSSAGISLLMLQAKELEKYINHCESRIILIFFGGSIAAGIGYRIVTHIYHMYINRAFATLLVLIKQREHVTYGIDIEKDYDFIALMTRLKADFDIDISQAFELYLSNENERNKYYEQYYQLYYDSKEWAKADYEEGMRFIETAIKGSFNYTDEEVKKLIYGGRKKSFWERVREKKYNRYGLILFVSSCLFFVLGVVWVFISYWQ